MNVEKYIERKNKSGEWAGHIELALLQRYLVPIKIYDATPSCVAKFADCSSAIGVKRIMTTRPVQFL